MRVLSPVALSPLTLPPVWSGQDPWACLICSSARSRTAGSAPFPEETHQTWVQFHLCIGFEDWRKTCTSSSILSYACNKDDECGVKRWAHPYVSSSDGWPELFALQHIKKEKGMRISATKNDVRVDVGSSIRSSTLSKRRMQMQRKTKKWQCLLT